MKGLPTPVRRILREASDDLTLERVWRRVSETRSGDAMRLAQPYRLRWVFAASGIAAAAVLAFGVWGFWHRPPVEGGPLRLASGQEIEPTALQAGTALRQVTLSDGSELEIAAGTTIDLLENDGHRFNLLLVHGKTSFDVRPGGPRRWEIETGLASVEVVGTRFTVARSETRVHLEVDRGTVLVRSDRLPERIRTVTVAQALDIDEAPTEKPAAATEVEVPNPTVPAKRGLERSAVRRHTAPHLAQTAAGAAPSIASAPPAQPEPAVEWKALAREGAFASAYNALGSTGVVKETARAPRSEDLFALADIARYSGHPASAVSPLEEIVLHHREEPLAAMAAFTLGKIQLESLGDPKRAAEAFAQAVELQPPRGILESAYARLVESRAKAGDDAGARTAAAEYLKRFPEGQFRKEMESWLSRN